MWNPLQQLRDVRLNAEMSRQAEYRSYDLKYGIHRYADPRCSQKGQPYRWKSPFKICYVCEEKRKNNEDQRHNGHVTPEAAHRIRIDQR